MTNWYGNIKDSKSSMTKEINAVSDNSISNFRSKTASKF